MKKKTVSIKTGTQLAIFLDNRPGTLAAACDALATAKINIDALATEGGGFGPEGYDMLVRMVADDPTKAAMALGEVGAVAVPTDVLLIESANEPGILAKIAGRLAKAEIQYRICLRLSQFRCEKLRHHFAAEQCRSSDARSQRFVTRPLNKGKESGVSCVACKRGNLRPKHRAARAPRSGFGREMRR